MNVHRLPSVRRLLRVLVAESMLLVLVPLATHVETAAADSAPPASVSRYMFTTNPQELYNDGCAAGHHATQDNVQNSLIVLDFGQADSQPDGSGGTIWGTYLYNKTFASTTDISLAAKSFADGFWDCTSFYGPTLTLTIGTSNQSGALADDPSVWSAHGVAWGNMVNNIESYIDNSGYSSELQASGASDMEVNWNSSTNTRAWADGYGSTPNSGWFYYDYGDASACPLNSNTNDLCNNPNNSWMREDVWYVSWGAISAFPLPEIYTPGTASLPYGSEATQWHDMSSYSFAAHGYQMDIAGELTQYAAEQQSCSCQSPNDSLSNTPSQAWNQLYRALNDDPNTQQGLLYSTDIQNG